MLTRTTVLLMALAIHLGVPAHAAQSTAPQLLDQVVAPTITGVTTSEAFGMTPPSFFSTITGKGGDCSFRLDIRNVPIRGEPSQQLGPTGDVLNRSNTGKNWPPNFSFATPYKPGVKYVVRVYGSGPTPCAGEAHATFGPTK